MSLPITVPYIFGNVTSSIPLTNLDSDFATVYAAVNGIGNGTVALANVVITGGTISANISGNTTVTGNITATNSTTTGGHYSQGALGVAYTDGIVLDYVTNNGRISVGGGDGLTFYNGGVGNTALMTLNSSGQLGIGTSSPAYTLDVIQNVNSDGAVQITNSNTGTSAVSEFRASNGTNFAWYGIAGTSYGGYAQIRTGGAAVYTNSSAGIGFSADNSSGYITFGTGSSAPERMRIDSSGNVGIGTSSPSSKLAVNGGTSTSQIRWEVSNASYINEVSTNAAQNAYVYKNYDASYHIWKLSGSEAMRIDSNGDLLVGLTSSGYSSSNRGLIQTYGSTDAVVAASCSSGSGYLYSSSSGLDVFSSVNGYMRFLTNSTERMRIDSSGNLMVGTTSVLNGNTKLSVYQNGPSVNCIWAQNAATNDGATKVVATTGQTTASSAHYFYDAGYNFPTSFTRAFAVRGDGVIFALNTTIQSLSDERLKENIVNSQDGLNIIQGLRPVRFDWKKETGIEKTNQLGFIAQEVEQVFPEAVDKFSNNENNSIEYKSVGSGALIPVLVKAIQEQQALITALQTQVTALQAKVGA